MCQCGEEAAGRTCPGTCQQTGGNEAAQPEEIAVPAEVIKPVRFTGTITPLQPACQCPRCQKLPPAPPKPTCQCDACRR